MISGEVEVAIVGAGAAGIGAARRLAEAGVEALMVEARDRLGGRAWTIEAGGHALDLGCGWLHSGDRNPRTAIARGQGLAIDQSPPPWSRRPAAGRAGFDAAGFADALWRFRERADGLAETEPDRAASAFLEPDNPWNPLIDAVSTYYSGARLDRVSARDLARYADTGVNWRVAEGYGRVIAAHGAGLPVALSCEVARIDRRGALLRLETNKGAITARAVILTLPSALIAAKPDLFLPALPDKTEAAAGLPLGLADKLYFALDGAEEFEADSRAFGAAKRADTAAYHLRPFGRPLIEAYFGGPLALELEAAGEGAFAAFATQELVGLFGADFARRLTPLAQHGWARDPLARGSYSFALPGRADDRAALAAPVEERVYFAGEACSTPDYSTAHGAYRTGVAAAERIIAARAA
jgi:monoamine oxidase